jgi:hypothetical protein
MDGLNTDVSGVLCSFPVKSTVHQEAIRPERTLLDYPTHEGHGWYRNSSAVRHRDGLSLSLNRKNFHPVLSGFTLKTSGALPISKVDAAVCATPITT